ncbi:MAG: hypothetical protein LUE92_09880, partial [Clostridiales bacterium]|nr:hypothetical protein [Clostridiales bacterium]
MRDLNVNIYGDINLILPDLAGMVAAEAEDAFSEKDGENYEMYEDEEEDELEEEEAEALLALCSELLKECVACGILTESAEKIPEKEKEG